MHPLVRSLLTAVKGYSATCGMHGPNYFLLRLFESSPAGLIVAFRCYFRYDQLHVLLVWRLVPGRTDMIVLLDPNVSTRTSLHIVAIESNGVLASLICLLVYAVVPLN
jgi:hypothetical protein